MKKEGTGKQTQSIVKSSHWGDLKWGEGLGDDEEGMDGRYHYMSRVVSGKFLLGGKEFFVRWMWLMACVLQVEILDYVVMSNHYHQLVRVPGVVKAGTIGVEPRGWNASRACWLKTALRFPDHGHIH